MNSMIEYDYDKVLRALGETYISLYLFNLDKNTLMPIKSNSYIDKWAAEREGAQEKTNHVMENITFPEHVSVMLNFVNLSTLNERLAGKNAVTQVFQGKIHGWCLARFIALDRHEDGSLHQVIYAVENINRLKERENHLLHLAEMDQMTGILNHISGEVKIRALLEEEEAGVFGLFDIDHFKLVNDRYGHQVGDQVLIAVADCMKKVFRQNDILLRLGGDEFAFYAVGVRDKDVSVRISERLFGRIADILIEPMTEKVMVSMGLAMYQKGDTFEDLYNRADKGVYDSKHNKGSSLTIK